MPKFSETKTSPEYIFSYDNNNYSIDESEKVDCYEIKPDEKYIIFDVTENIPNMTNRDIFKNWLDTLDKNKKLPDTLIMDGEAHSVSYLPGQGDEININNNTGMQFVGKSNTNLGKVWIN